MGHTNRNKSSNLITPGLLAVMFVLSLAMAVFFGAALLGSMASLFGLDPGPVILGFLIDSIEPLSDPVSDLFIFWLVYYAIYNALTLDCRALSIVYRQRAIVYGYRVAVRFKLALRFTLVIAKSEFIRVRTALRFHSIFLSAWHPSTHPQLN